MKTSAYEKSTEHHANHTFHMRTYLNESMHRLMRALICVHPLMHAQQQCVCAHVPKHYT